MRSTLRLADCGDDGRSTSVTVTCLERDAFDPDGGCLMYNKASTSTAILPHTRLYLKHNGNSQPRLK